MKTDEPRNSPTATPPPIARWEWIALAVITLVGGLLRFWHLDVLPPGLWYDEAINGLDAWGVIHGHGFPIFFMTEGHPREPLYMYLEAIGILVGGPNATAIRAVSAAIGTLTIPAVWWMSRQFMGPRDALTTACVFSFMRWHVHFSRLAFRTILTPFFAALITGFLYRTIRKRKLLDAIATGALLSLSLYTYLSMRLFVVAALIGIVLGIVWKLKVDGAHCSRRASVAGILAAIIVFLPLGIDYIANPEHFSGREKEVSLISQGPEGWARIARQARDVALMPAFRGDHVGKHNIPGPPRFVQSILWSSDGPDSAARWIDRKRSGAPEMDPHGTGIPVFDIVTGLLFYFGFAVACKRAWRRQWPEAFLIVWLIVGSLASVLSFGAPNMLRLLLLTPAVAAVLALGLEAILAFAETRTNRHLAAGILLVFLAWFAAGEMLRYFRTWPDHPATDHEFNNTFAELARALRSADDAPEMIIVPDWILNSPTFKFETLALSATRSDADIPTDLHGRIWVVAPQSPWPPVAPLSIGDVAAKIVQSLDTPEGDRWVSIVEVRVP
ncbi:glycosyltransferase family 39 protein [bacterium]|nr:glycosyltransferase family 39 protein [bacterium]